MQDKSHMTKIYYNLFCQHWELKYILLTSLFIHSEWKYLIGFIYFSKLNKKFKLSNETL